MIAFEREHLDVGRHSGLQRHRGLNCAAAIGAAVDQIAEMYDPRPLFPSVAQNARMQLGQEFSFTVHIAELCAEVGDGVKG